jgi:hypothetical protein
MAQPTRRGETLVVSLSTWEKLEAQRRRVVVPWAAVRHVAVVEDVIHQINGLRPRQPKLFGTYLPGRLAVGIFLDGLRRPIFAAVHGKQPRGLRIALDGARYGQLLISCPDPEAVKERLAAVAG